MKQVKINPGNFVQTMPREDEICPQCLDKGEYTVTVTATGQGAQTIKLKCYCGRPTTPREDNFGIERATPPNPKPFDNASGGRNE